ncbi:MauE/DoxX family redox-associated membrane protein [Flavitalea flava]
MQRRQVLLETISALLILLFLYASLSKFLDFKLFTGEMNNQPFSNALTPFLVWAIPLLEIGISICLIFEWTRLIGFYGSLVLMSLFTIYTAAILLHFFKYVPCSCGGVIKKLTWKQHLIFNLFFTGLSITGIVLQKRKTHTLIHLTKNSLV